MAPFLLLISALALAAEPVAITVFKDPAIPASAPARAFSVCTERPVGSCAKLLTVLVYGDISDSLSWSLLQVVGASKPEAIYSNGTFAKVLWPESSQCSPGQYVRNGSSWVQTITTFLCIDESPPNKSLQRSGAP